MQLVLGETAYNILILMYKVQVHSSLHGVKNLHVPNSILTCYMNYIYAIIVGMHVVLLLFYHY